MGIFKNTKTHKGRKILEEREAKLIENPKKSILVKGSKTSQTIQDLMKDLHFIRGSDASKLFMRKSHDMHPFEDIGPVEQFAAKQDSSLFVLGSHQKKRPDNIVFGRTFAGHMLDMFEFGVSNYQAIKTFNVKEVDNELKPVLVFQGEQFEFSEKHTRFKNWCVDFFKFSDYEEVNIAELKRVLVFTSTNNTKIEMRHFEMAVGK